MNRYAEEFLNFIALEKRYSPHTLSAYRVDLEQFSSFFLKENGNDDLERAAHFQIRNWMASLVKQGVSTRSVNRKMSTLKSFFKYLLRQQVITRNPMLKVQRPKVSKRLPVFVDDKSMRDLFSGMKFTEDWEGRRDRLMMELLYVTGMRRSELLGLTSASVDSYQQQIKVLGKGNKERLIPISAVVCDSLKEWFAYMPKADGTLFTSVEGEPLKAHQLYSIVRKYLGMVTTINKKSPHVLRHTFATHLLNNGADINAVKELLGHSSLAATQVYTHNTIDKLKSIYRQAHPRAS